MTEARCLRSRDTHPHRNLAREEALLLGYGAGGPDIPALYLWQNAKTVVIGRNQNAWRECRTGLLESEGGVLARRTTGGGAVFHDLGNLNFSFLMPRGVYDLARQLSVVRAAVRSFGIDCAFSGRNDLLAGGRKFSGNAFRFTRDGALHHGTLMVAVDAGRMGRSREVSPEKLAARGVKSVASRVVNLGELGDVTIEALAAAMFCAFRAEYGDAPVEDMDALTLPEYEALAARNAAWEWNYGAAPSFDASFSTRFEWGGMEVHLSLEEGRVRACRVYTDAMDPDLAARVEAKLAGCPLDAMALRARFCADAEPNGGEKGADGDIGDWLGSLAL